MKPPRMGLVLSLCCSETPVHQLDSSIRKRTHSRYFKQEGFYMGKLALKKSLEALKEQAVGWVSGKKFQNSIPLTTGRLQRVIPSVAT